VEFVHIMPLTVMSSMEVDGVKAILYLKANGILSLFCTFFVLFVYNKVWEMFTKVYWVILSFIKIGNGESHTLVRGIKALLSVLSASLVHLG